MTYPSRSSTQGHLIAWIVLVLYALFTLMPNSNSLAVDYPWVLLWQTCYLGGFFWFLARLWLLGQMSSLGRSWDLWSLLILLATAISVGFAEFRNQAIWNAITVVCWLATLYVLSQSLTNKESSKKLLKFQGLLIIAFIIISLFFWLKDTYLPTISHIGAINQKLGLHLFYDFSILDLRNWAPLGHPNYVAGYLILGLPLLVGLAISEKGKLRWLYLAGIGFGLIDLYTTSSKAAWLSLILVFLLSVIVLFRQNRLPKKLLTLSSIVILVILLGLIFSNNRLSRILLEIISGKGGSEELTFRTITNDVGYQMGLSHLWSGIGIGGVPLLYQKYHPVWAGFQAEWLYQLHSTPVELFAELGIWGVLLFVLTLILLIFKFLQQPPLDDQPLYYSICAGILGYLLVSLTDYQLDNLAINGLLLIYAACLNSYTIGPKTISVNPKATFYGGLAFLTAIIIWSVPVQMAWSSSSQGFLSLSRQNIRAFSHSLSRAHQLAQWEPYYPLQLGWNLGDLADEIPDQRLRRSLLLGAINWLEKGVKDSPYLEFGRSSLGWLWLNIAPEKATASFIKAIELIPAKKNNAYGLGLSLLMKNRTELAIKAFTLECLRRPVFITSPFWQTKQLQPIYPRVLKELNQQYDQLLSKYTRGDEFYNYLHQARGGLNWWRGNFDEASGDFRISGDKLSQLLLRQATGESIEREIDSIGNIPAELALKAWYDRERRIVLIEKSWSASGEPPMSEDIKQQFIDSFKNTANLEQWIKQKAPILQYRNQRPNFNVNSRHLGGPLPLDFHIIQENAVMNRFFGQVLPSPVYMPELDRAIEPIRQEWLKSIKLMIGQSQDPAH